ncbi:MAG: RlmE family RNA methyltransferase [Coxiellaceae bacterium]|nr:RlmE family RNA methyltransferase [Coxiellaceae bacterium]
MKKTSSKRWLRNHFSDIYVRLAKREGLRARSAYKLIEINKHYKIIRPNMNVVDLGASPGGWSEYIAEIVGVKGKIFAIDILDMRCIIGVEFIRGDFTDIKIQQLLYYKLCNQKVDVMLSDMAPNLSGVKDIDQMRIMDLADKVLNFSCKILKNRGTVLIKLFHGVGFDSFVHKAHRSFSDVKVIKPKASQLRSSEVFLLIRNFNNVIMNI